MTAREAGWATQVRYDQDSRSLEKKEIGIAKPKIELISSLSTNACDVVPELYAPVGFPLK
ncbi:hypothetical protein [Rhizobium sp. NFR07]|uniref:hypothetical protein n=1 Tax=Rhizobium sp. NFR07 TaxID=1566262 RepID=UPI0011601A8E|nr:hypothetical protein [Rhizobium sp. NFR07]